MARTVNLSAEAREQVGKGAARAIRRQGRVPAVIYGDKRPPFTISIASSDLNRAIETGSFLTTLINLDIKGENTSVLPRDVQFDPVRDFPVHVDFLRLGEGATINVDIPVSFINEEESPGIERGGVLNVVRHTVELVCPAAAIPDEIVGDLAGLDIGDSIHISDIPLPDGVVPTITDRDFTVATIAAPALEPVEPEEDEDLEDEDLEGEEGEGEEGEDGEDGDDDKEKDN